ncbi:two-component system QseEF-associated lipoprotein QseG [Scandinavium sp.]|uniref:two-component system QseEF-associated lipoprotein QseG n=1 Tax=Scandinavium sp. TaxID=2830653 RepID=UPI0028A267ED|nr:two-component system QseEF-associated lipoprotein QseG [Scandinavium sp.]
MKQRLVNMSPRFLSLLAGASCLWLAGCVSAPQTASTGDEDKLPQQQVADFLSTDCADVWSLHGAATEKNPLYWLRSMDCAERLSPEMARSEARLHSDESWQDALRRGILLGSAKITPLERREMVTRLDTFSPQIPTQVRPLYQFWRDGQSLQLQLSDERSRYSKLQQTTDAELDILRQQQQHLSSQLELTTRKLENLTDIERQLSSRKPAGSNFTPDAGHAGDAAPAQKDAPSTEEKP